MGLYPVFRSLLFRLDPERAHALSLNLIRLAGAVPPVAGVLRDVFRGPAKPVEAFRLQFSNPIGLAAGYDKDGLGWRGLALLGFGHIEIGTVTVRPQPGNPRPRLFRLPEDRALINRMGFPGRGAEYVARQLKAKRPTGLVLGVNLGKNRDTPLEEAVGDYASLYKIFSPLAGYLAVNVSSPNTIGLRRLQARQALDELLSALDTLRREEEASELRRVPVLVKLAPDLSDDELDDALTAIMDNGMDGVIATNTTLSREGLCSRLGIEAGGLSGEPLRPRAVEIVRKIHHRTAGRLPVIGVGGITNVSGVQEMMDAGAVLVQLYTGLIYEGPGLVKRILSEL